MTDVKRIAEGFFWNHIGRSLEFLLAFLFSVLIAKFLGSELNGIYASILSLVFFSSAISSFGLETSVNSLFPKYFESNISKAATTIRKLIIFRFFVSSILAITLYLFKEYIIAVFNITQVVLDYFIFILLFFTLKSIISIINSFFIAFFKTKVCYSFAVSVRLLELILLYILLFYKYGLREIFILLTVTNLIQIVLLIIYLRKIIFKSEVEVVQLREVITLGGKFWLNSFLEFFLGKQAFILILGIFAIEFHDIGNFDVSFSFAQAINLGLTTGLYGISVSAFSSIEGGGKKNLENYWIIINQFVLLVLIPAFIFVILYAKDIIITVYSNQYIKSILWLQLFSSIFLVTRIIGGGLSADYLQSKGKVKELLLSSFICGVLNISLTPILIKFIGVYGAVASLAMSNLLLAALHYHFVKQNFEPKINLAFAIKIILLSLLCGASVLFINYIVNIQNLFISLLIYLVLIILVFRIIKPLNSDEFEIFEKVDSKFANIIKKFASTKHILTDRQKWAFCWLPKSNLVVDVGCSNTPLIDFLNTKCKIVIGIDTDLDALRSINKKDVSLIAASAENIPIETGVADVVLMLDVLEHVNNDRMALAEAWRILKKDGILILSVPYKGLFSFLDPQNLSMKIKKKKDIKYHKHYSYKELRFLFFRLFKIERVHYGGLFLYPLSFGASNFFKRNFGLDLSAFFKKVGDIDNDISWGRLSYNIILLARKI